MFTKIILLTLLTTQTKSLPVNGTDFIILGNHADLVRDDSFFVTTRRPVKTVPPVKTTLTTSSTTETVTTVVSESSGEVVAGDAGKDDVVFVPAERNVVRNDRRGHQPYRDDDRRGSYNDDDNMKLSDVYSNKKKLGDVVKDEAEPQGDVVFVASKYNDVQEKPKSRENTGDRHEEAPSNRRSGGGGGGRKYYDTIETTTELDCSENRICDYKEINSICAAKRDLSNWRFRLFRNECFFKKVNCQFSWPRNRYVRLELHLCKNAAVHSASKDAMKNRFIPLQGPPEVSSKDDEQAKMGDTRRVMSGRRAISLSLTGVNCGHFCPQKCTDDYVPECAESNTGEKRVFQNHCVMDDNSCKLGLTWKIRPMVDCIGSKKADVQQNRAFIDWMLKIGILDKKGRLNMSD